MSIKVIVKIRHNEYEYLLFKKNSLKHSMNKIQRKNNTIGNYEIKKKICLALVAKFLYLIMELML